MSQSILSARHISVEHDLGRGEVLQAVADVSFEVARGEILGLVGESGCGKSSTGAALAMLPPPTAGSVHFDGVDVASLRGAELRRFRTRFQIIFQDPISSLNPRRRVRQIVSEGLVAQGLPIDPERIDALLEAVGLDPEVHGPRRPRELSGGQCQRVAIARALAVEPAMLICDESVSALDVSVQAQIINLLKDLREEFNLTMLFIAHDLAVVRNISDRIAVMYLGRLCELAPSDSLYTRPAHPYTVGLLEAVPVPDPEHEIMPFELEGDVPSPIRPPSGCRFRTRCPRSTDVCSDIEPQMVEIDVGHMVACHHPVRPE